MKVGTKSILFGAHCWFIHPWFVALAWWKLYGFPSDYRLWVAFFVHDLGYWGKPNMDGPEGETHVEFGAKLMHKWFDHPVYVLGHGTKSCYVENVKWFEFMLYHSRFYAKKDGKQFSRLCVADKLSITLEPWWLYLPRVIATGEIKEYMELARTRSEAEHSQGKYTDMKVWSASRREWFKRVCDYLRKWVEEHKDMREDTWTAVEKSEPSLHSGQAVQKEDGTWTQYWNVGKYDPMADIQAARKMFAERSYNAHEGDV